jgi:hypothetical protein
MGPTLVFVPDRNRPNVFDATGAFWPEAQHYCLAHRVTPAPIVKFPAVSTIMAARREPVLRALAAVRVPLETIAFFCHGYRDGLQAGFARADVVRLSQAIAMHSSFDAYVLLYACDAGRDGDDARIDDTQPGPGGDGGFADYLRDTLEQMGRRVTVVGHATAGHCTMNPYARRFAPGTGGKGGTWYVEPGSPLWARWVRALKEPNSTLRFRYPRMSSEAIAEELMLRVA